MKNLKIGDIAVFRGCDVKILSVNTNGLSSPHYRFCCLENDHEHAWDYGDATSYRLLSPIKEEV